MLFRMQWSMTPVGLYPFTVSIDPAVIPSDQALNCSLQ